jgi:hypothetical protein
MLRLKFPELKKWCKESLWAPSCFHGSVGQGWEVVKNYISPRKNMQLKKGWHHLIIKNHEQSMALALKVIKEKNR